MLPVGDPLKDSGSSEEKKRKKQVRRFSPIVGPHINKNASTKHYGKRKDNFGTGQMLHATCKCFKFPIKTPKEIKVYKDIDSK